MKKLTTGVLSVALTAAGVTAAGLAAPAVAWADDAPVIQLLGTTADAAGVDNVTVEGAVVTITAAGTYTLSGTLDDGQIVVRTPGNKDEVELVLDGVTVRSSTSGPLFGANGKLTLTLAAGTVNTFEDAAEYVYAEGEDEPNAAVFAKRDLTVQGDGALDVTAHFNNGIGSKADLQLKGGTVTVSAPNNAVKGNDSIEIKAGATLHATAGEDGLKSDSDDGEGYGYVEIKGGTVDVVAGADGIQALTDITVAGGAVTVTADEDGLNCQGGTVTVSGGTLTVTSAQDAVQAETDLSVTGGTVTLTAGGGSMVYPGEESAKGLKGLAQVTVSGGDITVDASDDAVHSNGVVLIDGGRLDLRTADDGIHADTAATVQGDAEVTVHTSYEGLEALTVTIAGGRLDLTASDDGVNAAGGADQSNTGTRPGGRPGGGVPGQGSGNGLISVTGGTTVVHAGGDGLDANGSITISGGVLVVHGPTASGDTGLDCDGTLTVSGGVVAVAARSALERTPASGSQKWVRVTFGRSQPAGSRVSVTDAGGAVIASLKPDKAYQSVYFSAPGLSGTVTLTGGGTTTAEQVGGFFQTGVLDGATTLTTATATADLRVDASLEPVTDPDPEPEPDFFAVLRLVLERLIECIQRLIAIFT